MLIKKKLQQDLNSALKNREDLKRVVLGSLLAAVHNKEIEKRTAEAKNQPQLLIEELQKVSELTDEEIIKVIKSEIKKRKQAIELYEKGGRQDLAQKEKNEMEILLWYAPELR